MPSTSKRQHNAMQAAAHSNSNLGITAAVGKEFVKADKGKSFGGKAKKKKPNNNLMGYNPRGNGSR